ncbi:hypothetical protein ACP70R_036286 [Stipagrostis hirtigluma subsp. patula]
MKSIGSIGTLAHVQALANTYLPVRVLGDREAIKVQTLNSSSFATAASLLARELDATPLAPMAKSYAYQSWKFSKIGDPQAQWLRLAGGVFLRMAKDTAHAEVVGDVIAGADVLLPTPDGLLQQARTFAHSAAHSSMADASAAFEQGVQEYAAAMKNNNRTAARELGRASRKLFGTAYLAGEFDEKLAAKAMKLTDDAYLILLQSNAGTRFDFALAEHCIHRCVGLATSGENKNEPTLDGLLQQAPNFSKLAAGSSMADAAAAFVQGVERFSAGIGLAGSSMPDAYAGFAQDMERFATGKDKGKRIVDTKLWSRSRDLFHIAHAAGNSGGELAAEAKKLANDAMFILLSKKHSGGGTSRQQH